jgi:predicted aldo/keto reductase-like oxidoreductase
MKFILGTVGSPKVEYENLSKIFDAVYEHYGKETIIDTGHGYMLKDDKNNAEAYIGRWIKERGLTPEKDIKVIDKIGLWYDENSDGERTIKDPSQVLDEINQRLGFIPETILIHALKDIPSISDERYLKLAQFIEDTPEIKTSGFSAHMQFEQLLMWITKLTEFSKQHYAMLPYSVLSDTPHIFEDEQGKHFNQTPNIYGIKVWNNPTTEGFKVAKNHNFETIIMMPREQGKIKQVSYAPAWLNWCFRYACMNEYADYVATSSLDVSHIKEDMAIAEGEWYHPTNKEGLRDKIVAESEELGNW